MFLANLCVWKNVDWNFLLPGYRAYSNYTEISKVDEVTGYIKDIIIDSSEVVVIDRLIYVQIYGYEFNRSL